MNKSKTAVDRIIDAVEESKGRSKSKGTKETVDFLKQVFADPKPKWEYYTERGERKRKLLIKTFTGNEARSLNNDSIEIISSYHKGVFSLFMEETLE